MTSFTIPFRSIKISKINIKTSFRELMKTKSLSWIENMDGSFIGRVRSSSRSLTSHSTSLNIPYNELFHEIQWCVKAMKPHSPSSRCPNMSFQLEAASSRVLKDHMWVFSFSRISRISCSYYFNLVSLIEPNLIQQKKKTN